MYCMQTHSPWTNLSIWSYCSLAWLSFTKSILFCRIIMCFNFIISIAARCSEVWGWGQDSFPAEKHNNNPKLKLALLQTNKLNSYWEFKKSKVWTQFYVVPVPYYTSVCILVLVTQDTCTLLFMTVRSIAEHSMYSWKALRREQYE